MNVSMEHYTRVRDSDPTIGRLYHHMAILVRPHHVCQLFNYLKSLTVSEPYHPAREPLFTLLKEFVGPRNQSTTELAEVLSVDESNFYTAVSRLILASEEAETLNENGTCEENHLHAFDTALASVAGFSERLNTPDRVTEIKSILCLNKDKTVPLLETSLYLEIAGVSKTWHSAVLVGPASHYVKQATTSLVSEPNPSEDTCSPIPETMKSEVKSSLTKVVLGSNTDGLFEHPSESKELTQSYMVYPRYGLSPST